MAPRSEEANRQIREERKKQILDAALKVFANKGFVATKISDIAAETGLSHGLTYHYFKSKDEIFTELVKKIFRGWLNTYHLGSELSGSPLEKILAMTEDVLNHAYQGSGVNRFLLMIEAMTSEAIPEEAKTYLTEREDLFNEFLVPIIIEGQKAGEIIDTDPEYLATAYFAMIKGLAIVYLKSSAQGIFPTADTVVNLFRK